MSISGDKTYPLRLDFECPEPSAGATGFWLNIQLDYDIEVEIDRHTAELGAITSLTA
jgi:hypothetical protein